MKKSLSFVCSLSALVFFSCSDQDKIESVIKTNLKNRFTEVEIISITPDSCAGFKKLRDLASSLELEASSASLNINKYKLSYRTGEISLDSAIALSEQEIENIKKVSDEWADTYFKKSEKCFLVKYQYNSGNGLKSEDQDYYSADLTEYAEGRKPFMNKDYSLEYGFNFYSEISRQVSKFLLDAALN